MVQLAEKHFTSTSLSEDGGAPAKTTCRFTGSEVGRTVTNSSQSKLLVLLLLCLSLYSAHRFVIILVTGVQTLSLHVTISHPSGGRLPLLSIRPAVTFPAAEHHRPLADTKLYCLVTEAHRCEQLAQGYYAAFAPSRIWTDDLLITSPMVYPLRHPASVDYSNDTIEDSFYGFCTGQRVCKVARPVQNWTILLMHRFTCPCCLGLGWERHSSQVCVTINLGSCAILYY